MAKKERHTFNDRSLRMYGVVKCQDEIGTPL